MLHPLSVHEELSAEESSLREEQPASANVDHLEDVLARDAACEHQEDNAKHGDAACAQRGIL